MCPLVLGSLREMFLQALLKFEVPAVSFLFLFTLSSLPWVYNVFDHLFGIRLGALEIYCILVP